MKIEWRSYVAVDKFPLPANKIIAAKLSSKPEEWEFFEDHDFIYGETAFIGRSK